MNHPLDADARPHHARPVTPLFRLMRLPPQHARPLHLALADWASGTPRQWWHLEIAATLPVTTAPRWVRLLAWLLARGQGRRLLPWLAAIGMSGLAPYRLPYQPPLAKRAEDAALLALCLLCTLWGLDSLNASRELLLIMLALLGASAFAWQSWREASRLRAAIQAQHAEVAAALTPSEATLGLAGLLIAAGQDYPAAQANCQRLVSQPDSIRDEELLQLGLASPAQGYIGRAARLTAAAWLLGVLAVAWPCWLTQASWQLAPATLGALLVHYVAGSSRPGWLRRGVHTLIAGLLCATMARLYTLL